MNILVLLKMVPDVVEELEVGPDGKSLATDFLRLMLDDRDGHALEEALLLKEKTGGKVTVVALEAAEIDELLFTALAKGADRAVKITNIPSGLGTRGAAELLAGTLPSVSDVLPADLILTGCQAMDDLDGFAGPTLAQVWKLPYLGLITAVEVDAAAKRSRVWKEFAAGVRGEFQVSLPAVLGIQAAEKPPRYVPVAKVRAAMKSQKIETVPSQSPPGAPLLEVLSLAKPEAAGHAEMIEGSPEEVAGKFAEILATRGLL
jgi:electron transfer flavoprotein beta subunit